MTMSERDVTSNLIQRAPGVYTGSSLDGGGDSWVDAAWLPESPGTYTHIPNNAVEAMMRDIDGKYRRYGEVLITCTWGLNRSPSLARLYCLFLGVECDMTGAFINKAWRDFYMENYRHFKDGEWQVT
jgi:hypothetical protein